MLREMHAHVSRSYAGHDVSGYVAKNACSRESLIC